MHAYGSPGIRIPNKNVGKDSSGMQMLHKSACKSAPGQTLKATPLRSEMIKSAELLAFECEIYSDTT